MKYGFRTYSAGMLCAGLLLSGCSSSGDAAKSEPAKTIREHEQNFDPSDYRRKPVKPQENPVKDERREAASEPEWIARTEKSMGYRVQLYSTTSIDDAHAALGQLRSKIDSLQIDAGRLDMSYDAPYYKVRAGDFLVKAEADTLREQLRASGMSEAWVVRDNVIRVIRERKK